MRLRIRAKLILAFLFVAGVSLVVATVVPLHVATNQMEARNRELLAGQMQIFNRARLAYEERAKLIALRLQTDPVIIDLVHEGMWSQAKARAESVGNQLADARFDYFLLPSETALALASGIVRHSTYGFRLARSSDLGAAGRSAYTGHLAIVRLEGEPVGGVFVGFPLIEDLSPPEPRGRMFQEAAEFFHLIQEESHPDVTLELIDPNASAFQQFLDRTSPEVRRQLFEAKVPVGVDRFTQPGGVWQVRLEPIIAPDGTVISIAFLRIARPLMLDSWRSVQKNFTIAALISFLLAILLAVRMSKSFSRPIRALSRRAHAVAAGDLDQPIEVEARDEIGDLAKALNTMLGELRRTLEELKRRAETIERQNVQLDRTIHELSRMKDYTENVLQSVGVGVLTFDRDRKITKINDAAIQILEAEGREVNQLEDLLAQGPLNAVIEEGLLEGETVTDREFELITFAGVPRPVEVTSGLLRRKGKGIGLVLSFRDLTLVKALQERVRRQDRLASLGHLSAGVAHEIRNPLAIIKGSAEILRRRFGHHPDEEGLTQSIIEEVRRLSEVVTNFLDFARPKEPTIVQGDLNAVIRKALALAEHHRAGRSVQVEVDWPPDFPAVPMDPEQCQQVFLNLILNALEAMSHGGVLTVRGWVDGASGCAVVEVQDTGEGMDNQTRANIFDPFFTSKEQGTGLGLSVVHMIVAAHGGRIEVDSSPGEGSVFRVFFPLDASVKEEQKASVPPLARED
jgi:two-component system sensor histidine kinase AtoS